MLDERSTARRDLAVAIHAAAVRGVNPRDVTRRAVTERLASAEQPIWIIALGKASAAMAGATVEALAAHGVEPAGGVIVGLEDALASPHPRVESFAGDHPVPDQRSAAASAALGEVALRVGGGGTVFVLLSGGATSLVASPAAGVEERELVRLFDGLLGSGADITVMNTVRKRFTRWGAGRLARALAPARVHGLIVSDVVGDDIASIGSGPCAPDPLDASGVAALIERNGLEPFVPRSLRLLLAPDSALDQPPAPNDPIFDRVECTVILGNRIALAAAAECARELGAAVKVVPEPLVDDATFTAQRIVDELVRYREAGLPLANPGPSNSPSREAEFACMIWGGETTVRLGPGTAPPGGRCQELALAAADALRAEGDRGGRITLLAAGTDGRDGPTDAAGAVVDATTWDAIRASGRDPAEDLVEHRSYAALDAAGALVRTGPSGTNVGDVVVGIVERPLRDRVSPG